MKGSLIERFNNKWEKSSSGCWIWIAATTAKGYGTLWYNGKMERAHRISWILHKGNIPEDQFVCHKCDTPACVNPEHLFISDNAGNLADMKKKSRAAPQQGEKNAFARLTESQVLAIREDNRVQREIAMEYGIDRSYVSKIKNYKVWTHI